MTEIAVYALVFIATLLVVDTVLRRIFGARRSSREINSRLEILKSTDDQASAYNALLMRRGFDASSPTPFSAGWFKTVYGQSGLELSVQKRALAVIGLFLVSWLVMGTVVNGLVLQATLTLVLTVLLVLAILLRLRARRMRKFVQQLPQAIDIVVRSLNAGHPLNAAIALVAREMPDPIGSEFGILNDQLTFGSELDAAMINMIERVGAEELKLLAVTVTVQRGTGGNLSEILENLSSMIRDRIMLKAKIKAISAEGRITAVIMALFPFFLFWMIRTMVPTYFDPVWDTGYGPVVVTTCLVIMSFGILILYRLVNFDF